MGQTLSLDIPESSSLNLARNSIVEKTNSKAVSSTLVIRSGGATTSNTDAIMTSTPPPVDGDAVSNFTVSTTNIKKDDGNAPLPFLYQQVTSETRAKRRRRGWCCRKRHQPDDDIQLLRSFSHSGMAHPNSASSSSDDDEEGGDNIACYDEKPKLKSDTAGHSGGVPAKNTPTKAKSRRTRITNRPDVSMSLWSVIKNAIGKDLTKLPLPVNFNEPLSMLQRLTEDFEYSFLIDKAALCNDPFEQLAYISAFTVSSFASSATRTGKPFNPLLGETFECDRTEDLGWRCISEQVSHHPPLVAQHCQGRKWICWQQFTMTSKFRGNSIEITPLGLAHLLFPKTGTHYTWRKVPTVVHNIMVGKLWIDQEGEMDIFNHSTGETCYLEYKTSSFFRGDTKRVEGTVSDKNKQPQIFLAGNWDAKMESFPILKVDSKGNYTLGPAKLLWTRTMPPADSEKYYNFTTLACQLNEMEDGVAPTDSRRRPDQRLMENGLFDEANAEKVKLEEKQRATRKTRLLQLAAKGNSKSKTATTSPSKQTTAAIDGEDDSGDREVGYTPAWFSLAKDQVSGKITHIYSGEYWECKRKQDWSRCPDVYTV